MTSLTFIAVASYLVVCLSSFFLFDLGSRKRSDEGALIRMAFGFVLINCAATVLFLTLIIPHTGV